MNNDIDNILKHVGRYECKDGFHYKFWQVKYVYEKDNFFVEWGRIGSKPLGNQIIEKKEMLNRIRDKFKKGYIKIKFFELDTYHEKVFLEHKIEEKEIISLSRSFKI